MARGARLGWPERRRPGSTAAGGWNTRRRIPILHSIRKACSTGSPSGQTRWAAAVWSWCLTTTSSGSFRSPCSWSRRAAASAGTDGFRSGAACGSPLPEACRAGKPADAFAVLAADAAFISLAAAGVPAVFPARHRQPASWPGGWTASGPRNERGQGHWNPGAGAPNSARLSREEAVPPARCAVQAAKTRVSASNVSFASLLHAPRVATLAVADRPCATVAQLAAHFLPDWEKNVPGPATGAAPAKRCTRAIQGLSRRQCD